jgi:Inner membrane protein CreD
MKLTHLLASLAIIGCTTVAWFVLGAALSQRTRHSSYTLGQEVSGVWGPAVVQQHPHAWFDTPNAPGGKAQVLPSSSRVKVGLNSDPKRRGLIWHRTYDVRFSGDYTFTNPTKIPQTFYVSFPLPPETAGLHGFDFRLGDDDPSQQAVPGPSGVVTRAIQLPASGSITLHAAYGTRGTDTWRYEFPDNRRITGFQLAMRTDFHEINFPVGTCSADPDNRHPDASGYDLAWNYPDVLDAQAIGMDMPKRLNAGPVAARIAFFAPVSLLFFVTVVLLVGGMKGITLHPMHVFFISAGFFAFHLLFAYLVDLLPLAQSFAIAAATSLLLVSGYLKAVAGKRLFAIALPAQSIYMVAFSSSFFMDGLTGITLAVLAVATLALLMFLTAKTDWMTFFTRSPSQRTATQ